ncbi:hypothetical protein [Kordia sp.]|uniref:hypothetical protein n=1 Tax=Kordia sp. TaxID=1965332 RepID=UPI003D6C119B
MAKRKSYTEEVEKLSKAIDISIEAYKKHPPNGWTQEHIEMVTSHLEEDKVRRLEATKKFRTMASLKYDIEAVFTYFQEASGTTVEYFWTKIKEAELDYTRENKLEKILNRGKIKDAIEYNYVTDMLMVAEQTGLTTTTQTEQLNKMLDDYESKKKK